MHKSLAATAHILKPDKAPSVHYPGSPSLGKPGRALARHWVSKQQPPSPFPQHLCPPLPPLHTSCSSPNLYLYPSPCLCPFPCLGPNTDPQHGLGHGPGPCHGHNHGHGLDPCPCRRGHGRGHGRRGHGHGHGRRGRSPDHGLSRRGGGHGHPWRGRGRPHRRPRSSSRRRLRAWSGSSGRASPGNLDASAPAGARGDGGGARVGGGRENGVDDGEERADEVVGEVGSLLLEPGVELGDGGGVAAELRDELGQHLVADADVGLELGAYLRDEGEVLQLSETVVAGPRRRRRRRRHGWGGVGVVELGFGPR
ncbi:hypothetical protein PVAP13_1KG167745 [Panicum virgatum]|uniref:Uncharacterized protein n=1 Tax=Panicum virgatum TaxID=38727 RepID=A0A8T0XRH8_PANVG|nr:hypothetical protein PVAP13_1KG167745 [Panicum virgatum]